jgi:CelD/BcsL family acetyltransferase involved in cellulose biosynthesis
VSGASSSVPLVGAAADDKPQQAAPVALERLSIAVLEGWPAVLELEPEWRALHERSDADPLFLSWEWLAAWYDVCGKSRAPYVVTARSSSGRLVGIAPFYRANVRLCGVKNYRGLRPLGDYPTGAEYLDWILDGERAADALAALAAALAGRADWQVLWLPYAAGWNGAAARLIAGLRRAGIDARPRAETFAAMPLPATYDGYLKEQSSKRRGKLKQAVRRALDEGGGRLDHCESKDDIPRFLDALFELHGQRWSAQGQRGTFLKKPTEAAFYRRFAPVAFDRGWLRLSGIVRDGVLAAVQIGYLAKSAFYQIQEGFDPATEGVGNALRAKLIERCIDIDHLTEYDFLQGFTEGKARWGATARTGHSIFAVRPGMTTTPLMAVGFWPTGRYLRFTDLGQ